MSNKLDRLIRKFDDPVLKQVCTPFDLAKDDLSFLDQLERVCRKYSNGGITAAGLAAPQLGVSKRVYATNTADARGVVAVRLYINPRIVAVGDDDNLAEEGCLSYPGVKKVVRRYTWIDLEWTDRQGRPRRGEFEGFAARVHQHEYDHLDGKCRVGDSSSPDGQLERLVGPKWSSRLTQAVLAGTLARGF
jgi:peptide deformylase